MANLAPKISYRVLDLVMTIISFLTAYFITNNLAGHTLFFLDWEISIGDLRGLHEYFQVLLVIPFIWWVVLNWRAVDSPIVIRNPKLLLSALVKANVTGGLILAGFFFLSKLYFPSRSQMVIFLFLNTAVLYWEKRILVYYWKVKKQEKSFQRILLIGDDPEKRRFFRQIENYPELGYKIVGCLLDPFAEEGGDDPIPVLGTVHEIEQVVKENPIEEVVVFSSRKVWEIMDVIAPVCGDMGIRLTIVPKWTTMRASYVSFRKLVGIPMVSFVNNPQEDWSLFFKMVFDFSFAFLAFLFFSPLFLIIALAIKIDSPGPVFFIQKRTGLNGRDFPLLKFRSMIEGAENQQKELLAFNEMSGPVFKMTNDPRITRVGAWLRKTSLDELPQLINVLKGDISLVGPRPPLPSEVALYERWQRRRLSVKPGITCTWQISGRNNINFDEWIKLDLDYIDHWTFLLDLKILIRTLPAVLLGRGAK